MLPLISETREGRIDIISQWLISFLGVRYRELLSLRLGLNGDVPHSREEAAKCFGISNARVRQLELTAMRQLRRIAQTIQDDLDCMIRFREGGLRRLPEENTIGGTVNLQHNLSPSVLSNLIGALRKPEDSANEFRRRLRSFFAFFRLKTLSHAALELGCNRQTVANHIDELSSELGELSTTVAGIGTKHKREITPLGTALGTWLSHHPDALA